MKSDTEFILQEIKSERLRQINECKHGGDTNAFDKTNTPNDFVAYITTYAGRATQKVKSNEKRGEEYRTNLIKVAALCLAAIETYDESQWGTKMAHTMSQEEHEQFITCIEWKTKELQTKEDITKFLQDVGYFDKYGEVAWPYNPDGREPDDNV